jgi:DNA-binding transcriptional ArsR family regulator
MAVIANVRHPSMMTSEIGDHLKGPGPLPLPDELRDPILRAWAAPSCAMPRLPRTPDPFNAVAEPCRRHILEFLAPRERPVNDVVAELSLPQPSVSKHLRILLRVGLVEARRDGRQLLYRTKAEAIRPLHKWTSRFERYWRAS